MPGFESNYSPEYYSCELSLAPFLTSPHTCAALRTFKTGARLLLWHSAVEHGAKHHSSLRSSCVCGDWVSLTSSVETDKWGEPEINTLWRCSSCWQFSFVRERPKCYGKVKSARLCLRDGVGNIYSSYRSNISCLLWQEQPVSLPPPPPPPLAELDCLVLWCSLATVIVPFSFTIFSMYVRPRLPKTVPDLAEMCYTIHLLLFLLWKVGFFWQLELHGKMDCFEVCHPGQCFIFFSSSGWHILFISPMSARKVPSYKNNSWQAEKMFVHVGSHCHDVPCAVGRRYRSVKTVRLSIIIYELTVSPTIQVHQRMRPRRVTSVFGAHTGIEMGKEESLPSVIADDKIQPSHQK